MIRAESSSSLFILKDSSGFGLFSPLRLIVNICPSVQKLQHLYAHSMALRVHVAFVKVRRWMRCALTLTTRTTGKNTGWEPALIRRILASGRQSRRSRNCGTDTSITRSQTALAGMEPCQAKTRGRLLRPHVIGGKRHHIGKEVDRRREAGDDLDAMHQTPIEYTRRASRAPREPLVLPSLSLSRSVTKIGIRKLFARGSADGTLKKSTVANS